MFLAHGIAFFDQAYIRPNLRKPCLYGVIVLQNCSIASVQQQPSRLNLQRWQWFQQTLRPLTPVDFRYFESATWSKKMRMFSDHFVTNTVEEIIHQLLDYLSSIIPFIYPLLSSIILCYPLLSHLFILYYPLLSSIIPFIYPLLSSIIPFIYPLLSSVILYYPHNPINLTSVSSESHTTWWSSSIHRSRLLIWWCRFCFLQT